MKFKRDVIFGTEARQKLLKGINTLAEAVSSTLGPRGRNVAINNPHTTPTVLHDGVSVARSINLKDPFEDMGAELLKATAVKTNEVAGDGTTTSTILAQAIIQEAQKQIAAGVNPMVIKAELEKDLTEVVSKLLMMAKDIKTDEEIEQIATISSASLQLGKLVAEAIKKVGVSGVIRVEEGEGFETTVKYKEGMEIDRGYLSPYFKTNEETVEGEIKDPYILITDKEIRYNIELIPLLDKFLKVSKNLVIIAGNVVEEALATLVVNKLRGAINVIAIQAPAYGGRRIDELEDIATLTGGTVIMTESGRSLETVALEELGRAEKIVSDRDKTVIIGGKGDKVLIKKRIEELEAQTKVSNTDFDKDIKRDRLANLAGTIAEINVGGTTEPEVKEKKERVIDAKNATRAAIEEGIVAGGEITLYTLSKYATGILKNALSAPLNRLLENSGIGYAQGLQMLANKEYPYGIDVMDGKVKDLIKSGVIDPAKVVRCALENAISIASLVCTTDVLVTEIEDRSDK